MTGATKRTESDACADLRRRRDWHVDRLFPQPSRGRGDRDREYRHRLRRVGQVGRVSGARLVRGLAVGAARPAKLRPTRASWRQRSATTGVIAGSTLMAGSPALSGRAQRLSARLDVGRRDGDPGARLAEDDGAGASRPVYRGDDARRPGAGCRTAARPGYRHVPCAMAASPGSRSMARPSRVTRW